MMKIYYLCLLVCALTFAFQAISFVGANFQNEPDGDISGQQRPPLPVDPAEECHIVDAVPLLRARDYKSRAYKLSKSKTKPLIITETISPNKFLDLKIEQRGCEDVYAKFDFVFKGKANQNLKLNLGRAARLLKNLRINPDALVGSKTIGSIADIAAKESKKAKPLKQTVICLNKIQSECMSDVSLKYERPNLQIFYVDRP